MMITNADIEHVARAMCKHLGIDPDATVSAGYGDDFTPAEWQGLSGQTIPLVMLYIARWRLYRGKAAEALAAKVAVENWFELISSKSLPLEYPNPLRYGTVSLTEPPHQNQSQTESNSATRIGNVTIKTETSIKDNLIADLEARVCAHDIRRDRLLHSLLY